MTKVKFHDSGFVTNTKQIFRIDYPLPKVDLLAVHEFVNSPFHLFIVYKLRRANIVAHYMSSPFRDNIRKNVS